MKTPDCYDMLLIWIMLFLGLGAAVFASINAVWTVAECYGWLG